MKLVKFNGVTYSSNVFTFEKAKALSPSMTESEYEKLSGNKVKSAPKKEKDIKEVK